MTKKKNNELDNTSKVPYGKYKSEKVGDNLVNDKKEIFALLKEGYFFTEEVLNKAGIIRRIKVVPHSSNRITDHIVDKTVYEKDTMSLKNILKSIHTIETSMNSDCSEEEVKNKDEENDTEE